MALKFSNCFFSGKCILDFQQMLWILQSHHRNVQRIMSSPSSSPNFLIYITQVLWDILNTVEWLINNCWYANIYTRCWEENITVWLLREIHASASSCILSLQWEVKTHFQLLINTAVIICLGKTIAVNGWLFRETGSDWVRILFSWHHFNPSWRPSNIPLPVSVGQVRQPTI